MNVLYKIEYGNMVIKNAPIDYAINYAIQWMNEHDKIKISKDADVEIHTSGCDKLTITPPLPEEENSVFMNNKHYI